MTRRNQQGKQQLKRAKKAVKAQLDVRRGQYIPDRTGCRERSWVTPVDDSNTIRIEFRIWTNGHLVDFVILIQRLGAQGWDEVERYDCCHGHCHRHRESKVGSQSIYQVDTPEDMQEAYTRASVFAGECARIIRDREEG